MARQALFDGLVRDELDRPVETRMVGGEAFYVVDDDGFMRHIASEQVDRQVLDQISALIEGHEDLFGQQTAKMLGQEDIFSVAMFQSQLKNIDQQFEQLFQTGIPEEARAFMGMSGFKVVIDIHGEVLRVEQAGAAASDDEDE